MQIELKPGTSRSFCIDYSDSHGNPGLLEDAPSITWNGGCESSTVATVDVSVADAGSYRFLITGIGLGPETLTIIGMGATRIETAIGILVTDTPKPIPGTATTAGIVIEDPM